MKTAFFCRSSATVEDVFGAGRRETIAQMTDLYPVVITPENIEEHLPALKDVEAVFSTWGMFIPTPAQFAAMPKWKVLFYGAGSVRRFAPDLLARGIRVMTASAANGTAVAEFTMAQILLANKGYFHNIQVSTSCETRTDWPRPLFKGNFEQTISLLGAGAIGRKVIELLRPFNLKVLVYDPFLPQATADALGVELVSLEEAFARGSVVSCHIANLPETQGMLREQHFASMQPGAVFINTGRGAQVVEEEMIAVLQRRPDLVALLDVTWPEPPVPDSPLYTMRNVFLSNHIAGTIANEHHRMADACIEECARYLRGEPLRWEVTMKSLEHMA